MSFSDISLIVSSTFIISCSILSFGLSCYKTYRDTSLEIIKSRDISRSNDNSSNSDNNDSDEVYILHSISHESSKESFTGNAEINETFTISNDFFVSEDYNSGDYTDINSDEFIEISLDLSQSDEIHDEKDLNTKSIIERTKESIKVLYTNQINLEKFIKERVNYLDNEYRRLINFIQSSNSENQNNLSRYNNILKYIENLSVA